MGDIPPPLQIAQSLSALLTEKLDLDESEVVLPRDDAVLCLGLLNAVIEIWRGDGNLLQ